MVEPKSGEREVEPPSAARAGSTPSDRAEAEKRMLFDRLVADLPDKPRWVMARGLCLSGRAEVLLGSEGPKRAGYFVIDSDRPTMCQAVHRPTAALVGELLESHPACTEILTVHDTAEHVESLLPGWVARPATAHIHPTPDSLRIEGREVRFLSPTDAWSMDALEELDAIEPRLAVEIRVATEHVPTVATIVDGKPVAFCYAAYETEGWWDTSIDTLAAHRRKGYASAAAAFLVQYMLQRGKRPVWGALDANEASRKMSAKYGFRAIDRMIVFTPTERRGSARA